MISGSVAIIGQGYVGLPISMRAISVGYRVIGFDTDQNRVSALQQAASFIEDVSDQEITDALATGRFTATSNTADLAGFDVAVVTVPTPLRDSVPDLSFIESAARLLAPHISVGSLVILESTTYPGTTEELMVPLLEEGSRLVAGTDFFVGYSPERIDPGNPIWNFVNTPKVVSGINENSRTRVIDFYSSLVDNVVAVSGCKEAELTKLLENTFRHVNIALVNELAMFANQLEINVWEAIDAASTKPFGFMRFTPGPGVGGHCLPIDPSYLSWRVRQTLGHQFRFVELANDINDHMPDYTVERLVRALNSKRTAVNGSRVVLIGLAYKKNSSDARESPAVRVAELLLSLGADLKVVDPYIRQIPKQVAGVDLVGLESLDWKTVDAVIILTDHDSIDYQNIEQNADYILDTRRRLSPSLRVEHL
jgi:UDP-N-acetyl-D-glucosamine dehydrogenase